MGFISQLEYEDLGKGLYKLTAPLVYVSKEGVLYEVEEGFITDLATIPDLLHFILPPNGDYEESAVLHDWLLKSGYRRSRASSLFLESMLSDDVILFEVVVLYLGTKSLDLYKSLLTKYGYVVMWWSRLWQ